MAKKRKRQTIYDWLTNRYQLIIRNEENFAEKTTISFNYAKVFVLTVLGLSVVLVLCFLFAKFVWARWNDEALMQKQMKGQVIDLSVKIDSLEIALDKKDKYINSFRIMLNGGQPFPEASDTSSGKNVGNNIDALNLDYIAPIDSQFRQEFEEADLELVSVNYKDKEDFGDVFFLPPIEGYDITENYNTRTGHYGVDIVARENEPIKSVADGTIILSSWTLDTGNVIAIQHENNIISVYKHNSVLLKKVGNFVKAGEIIAIIGNSGELSSGPHLHFELWYNGNPVDPVNFITF